MRREKITNRWAGWRRQLERIERIELCSARLGRPATHLELTREYLAPGDQPERPAGVNWQDFNRPSLPSIPVLLCCRFSH